MPLSLGGRQDHFIRTSASSNQLSRGGPLSAASEWTGSGGGMNLKERISTKLNQVSRKVMTKGAKARNVIVQLFNND
jgi:hypothetical protein